MSSHGRPIVTSPPLKHALTGLAGASVETYDFTIYATAAALVFPSEFFPAAMPTLLAQVASFSAFGVGFLTRPFGAALFGHLGDRIGRRRAFAIGLYVMGAVTLAIAMLPNYRTWGAFAPMTLVALRLIQGVAAGGQWGGSTLIATENAPASQRGFYGSIAQAAPCVAVILANLIFLAVSAVVSPVEFMVWGWRIPFALGIGAIGLGLYVRFRLRETDEFARLQQSVSDKSGSHGGPRSPVIQALARYPTTILKAGGTFIASNLAFYILITYVLAWGTSRAGLQMSRTGMLIAVVAAAPASATMFLAGSWSDRFGRRPVMIAGLLALTVWSFVLFPLIETRSWLLITVGIAVANAITYSIYGPMAAFFTELFDTRMRYSAVSLAYQIGILAGGASAPIIATALYAHFRSNVAAGAYMATACVISLTCLMALKQPEQAIYAQVAPEAHMP
jgi:MFS family permease